MIPLPKPKGARSALVVLALCIFNFVAAPAESAAAALTAAAPAEMLINGNFADGTNHWVIVAEAGATGRAEIVGEGPDGQAALRLKVLTVGDQPWRFQFYQPELRVAKGQTYVLTFWAKASQEGEFNVNYQQNHAPWAHPTMETMPLATEWKQLRFAFVAAWDDDQVRITFTNLGTAPGRTYWFATISLMPVPDAKPSAVIAPTLPGSVTAPSATFVWKGDCSSEAAFVNSNHERIPGHYEYLPDPQDPARGIVFAGHLTPDFTTTDPEKFHLHPEIYFDRFIPGNLITASFDVKVDDLAPSELGPYGDNAWLNLVTLFDETTFAGGKSFHPALMVNLVGTAGHYRLQAYSIDAAGAGTFYEKIEGGPVFPTGKWVTVRVEVDAKTKQVQVYQDQALASTGPYLGKPGLAGAHMGLYANRKMTRATVFNDDITITVGSSYYLALGKTFSDYRNVALNPLASTNREPASFPHAASNSEYNQTEFAARCAIDGNQRNDDVHGCGSWGPQKETNLWWRLDFGRPVTIDKLVLFLRAAWTPDAAPHDSYWKEATVEFSDGSFENLALKKVAGGQEFPLLPRTVTWLTLKNLKPAEDKWCALAEFEAWGRDASQSTYVADTAFAAKLRQDPLVSKALSAMMGFQRESWEQGVAGQALIEAGELDTALALARASLVRVNQSGVVAASGGSTTDPLMLGDCLWWAARQSGDPQLVKAADDMLRFALQGAPRADDGTPYHQAKEKEMWSDGTFTTPPFLAAAGRYDEAISQFRGVYRRLWDADKKLMHHRWSDPKQAFANPKFWGGGNGWTAAALARMIRSLPADRKSDRDQLATMLRELLDGCLAHQRTDGLFYDEVDNPSSYVETNLAAMLAYAIYESVRGGWLPESYLTRADQMRAAVRAKVDRFGFVQGVAGAPHFDQPGISAEGQAFFILMESAARKTR